MEQPKHPVIPESFVTCMHEVYGAEGARWVAALPELLEDLAAEWQLTLQPPFALTYNYVAPAARDDGTDAVIKVGYPSPELPHEMAAMRAFAGSGSVRLLATDEARGALLLERLLPGAPLATVDDDAEATRIAARLLPRIWRPPPDGHEFPAVADWGLGFRRLRARFDGGAGPFPPALVDEAETAFTELEATMSPPVLLHGDFHHGNILSAGGGDWRVIDAKGVLGEPAFEVATFLQNPRSLYARADPALSSLLGLRLDIFAAELALDRTRLRRWGIAQSVLSAWWSYEDHGRGWENAILTATLLSALG